MKKIFITTAVLFVYSINWSQQSDINRFNYLSQFISNPAAAGVDNFLEIGVYYQKSFSNIERAPTNMAFSAAIPFPYQNMGVGIALQSEQSGLIRYSNVIASYAYKVNMRANQYLSLGISGRVSQYAFEGSGAIINDEGDPLSISVNDNAISINFSAGVLFSTSSIFRNEENYNFKAGVSGGKLVPLDVNFTDNLSFGEKYFIHGHLSGRIKLNEGVKLSALLQTRYETTNLFLFSVNARTIISETFIAGIRFDHNRFFGLEIGGIIKDGVFGDGALRVVVHGDLPLSTINQYVNNGYGIGIYYLFDRDY